MATYQNQNQFAQTPLLGQVDLGSGPNNIVSARIDPSSSATAAQMQAGVPFKIVDVQANDIIVDVAAITDMAFGVIVYNPRKNQYAVGDIVELACRGSVVYMETSAAIARGANVQAATATGLVATRASTNYRVGKMLDKPTAANQLARVLIDPASDTGTT